MGSKLITVTSLRAFKEHCGVSAKPAVVDFTGTYSELELPAFLFSFPFQQQRSASKMQKGFSRDIRRDPFRFLNEIVMQHHGADRAK